MKRSKPLRSDPTKTIEWRKRSKPIGRTSELQRGGMLPPVNKKRKARAYERNYGDRADVVRLEPCLVDRAIRMQPVFPMGWTACSGAIVAAHAVARGMGGAKGDRRQLVPLCARHHMEAGELRTSERGAFESRYGIDLLAEAKAIAEALDRKGMP